MEIVKQLNLNKTPQAVDNGSMVFAKNIKLSADKQYLTSEESLIDAASVVNEGERIVGCIPTSKELVVFKYNSRTLKSNIIRIKEKEIGVDVVYVPSSWNYNNGKITGTYTYNINNELIIAIAESSYPNDIPLKTINLDTSKSDDNENIYNIAPDITTCNCKLNKVLTGVSIPNGVYHLFIRYEITDDVYTKWFPIGVPYYAINLEDKNLISHSYAKATAHTRNVINNQKKNCTYNFELDLTFKGDNIFKSYQIGYILQHDNSQVARLWKKFTFNGKSTDSIRFNVTGSEEYSIDELIEDSYNIFNVKTICNYNNRLYIANYKETNINITDATILHKINDIIVKPIIENISTSNNNDYGLPESNRAYINVKTLIPDQIYNFFIHYVYPDGSHTNGIKINNNGNKSFKLDELNIPDVTVDITSLDFSVIKNTWLLLVLQHHISSQFRVCDLYNNGTDTSFGYFENYNGDSMFKAPTILGKQNKKIGVQFSNIYIPKEFIGCFFSYEKVERTVEYTAAPYKDSGSKVIRYVATDAQLGLVNFEAVYYKELAKVSYALHSEHKYEAKEGDLEAIESMNILASDIYTGQNQNTDGANGSIFIELSNIMFDRTTGDPFDGGSWTTNIASFQNPNKYIYNSKNKELIRLGGLLYKGTGNSIYNGIYSENSTNSDFNYPGFIVEENIIIYTSKGVNIAEDNKVTTSFGEEMPIVYNSAIIFLKYSNVALGAISIKKEPEIKISTSPEGLKLKNLIIQPANLTDLYELNSSYLINYNIKSYVQNNKDAINNEFSKTIRRSDVIRTESAENSWRYFRADAYKVIAENKGNITNIVGIGLYLLVHTEHSLFMFNRDASMKTQDKDIQLFIPDAFDTEYQEVFTSDKGYGGLQNISSWVVCEHGYIFYDHDAKQIYQFDAGQLNIISTDIIEFIKSNRILDVVFALDSINDRLLICFRLTEFKALTISYDLTINTYISLHDYRFDFGWSTKNNVYLMSDEYALGFIIYTFKDSNSIGNYGRLYDKYNTFFPVYHNDDGNIAYSVIDIIFNLEYETIKSLEYINYVLTELLEYNSTINQAEQSVNRKYSGYQLMLYSDCCKSRLLDINVDNLPNQFNNYKYPYFDKGRWNLNYFRNYIEREAADNQSLIYGKYIVARFIFNNDSQKRFKLENINFGVNRY